MDWKNKIQLNKNKMDKWRLEYNEKHGQTNFEFNDKDNANTFGWKTVCDNLSEVQCLEFCDIIEKELISEDKPYPRMAVIMEEFELFLKSSPTLLGNMN